MIPLVSILIPAYNSERYIQATLDSAIGQTWNRKEIIVVDDGSRDRTAEIAKRYASRDVKVVEGEHRGAAAARNMALSLAQGDYIQWLDSDDLLGPYKIERQIEVANRDCGTRTLYSAAVGRFFWRPDRASFTENVLWRDHSSREWFRLKLSENVFMQPAAWLVGRSLTEMAGPWDERLTNDDDGEYFCRVIQKSDHIRFVPKAHVYYRRRANGSLANIGRDVKKLESLWLSMKMQINQVLAVDNNPEMRAACLRYIGCSLAVFYPERMDIIEEAIKIERELGGVFVMPKMGWKYKWLQVTCGWGAAKASQHIARSLRSRIDERFDWIQFTFRAASKYRDMSKMLLELDSSVIGGR